MVFGNLNSVLDGERSIYEAVESNILTNNILYQEDNKKFNRFSKILRQLSKYGMSYDDQVLRNMKAIPADKNLQPDNDIQGQSIYGGKMNNFRVKGEEDLPFNEKTLEQKREVLRKMAMQPELEDILDTMANESIVYDDDEAYIGVPFIDTGITQQLTEKSAEEIRNAVDTAFYKIYMLLGWKKSAWNEYKRWLIDGVLAYEIVYDSVENPHNIINIVPLDPMTLTKCVDLESGIQYWVQFKDVQGQERVLLDSQIIYVKYEDTGTSTRQSYLERLIRPFNLYRIVEQAQVIWTVTQSSFKTMFTIPINGMNRAKGMQTLNQAMNRYKEDIDFNTETGELMVNGRVNMPFNKEYWMPENENGTPQIETLVDNGPMLNDSDQIKYFESKLYKMSKIPESRFDKEAQATWFGSDPTQAMHDEIAFARFVDRMRSAFAECILKPLRIQLTLSIPDIKNDKRILDSVSFRFHTNNAFAEMAEIEYMTKRVEFIGSLKDGLTTTDEEGNDIPFFSMEFLIKKYLKMSDSDLELNAKLKRKEQLLKGDSKKESEDEEGGDNEKGEEGGGGGSESGGEADSEMLGDVQPESTETTQL